MTSMDELRGDPLGTALPHPEEAPAGSIQERVQQRQQELAKNRWVDMDIPGYDGDIFARYGLIDSQRLGELRDRVLKQERDEGRRPFIFACDTLIAACMEFFVRDSGREIPLREIIGQDVPVRYDEVLAEWVGFDMGDPPSARGVVLGLFGGNDIAIGAHNQRYGLWVVENGGADSQDF